MTESTAPVTPTATPYTQTTMPGLVAKGSTAKFPI
jgi:hypothetical protein